MNARADDLLLLSTSAPVLLLRMDFMILAWIIPLLAIIGIGSIILIRRYWKKESKTSEPPVLPMTNVSEAEPRTSLFLYQDCPSPPASLGSGITDLGLIPQSSIIDIQYEAASEDETLADTLKRISKNPARSKSSGSKKSTRKHQNTDDERGRNPQRSRSIKYTRSPSGRSTESGSVKRPLPGRLSSQSSKTSCRSSRRRLPSSPAPVNIRTGLPVEYQCMNASSSPSSRTRIAAQDPDTPTSDSSLNPKREPTLNRVHSLKRQSSLVKNARQSSALVTPPSTPGVGIAHVTPTSGSSPETDLEERFTFTASNMFDFKESSLCGDFYQEGLPSPSLSSAHYTRQSAIAFIKHSSKKRYRSHARSQGRELSVGSETSRWERAVLSDSES